MINIQRCSDIFLALTHAKKSVVIIISKSSKISSFVNSILRILLLKSINKRCKLANIEPTKAEKIDKIVIIKLKKITISNLKIDSLKPKKYNLIIPVNKKKLNEAIADQTKKPRG